MNNLFLDANNDDKKDLIKYFEILNSEIENNIHPWFPYITGNFEKKLTSFLENKNLPIDSATIEQTLHEMAEYFRGATRWHHPYVMNNIKTPVNLPALAVAFNAMTIDPNLAGDTNCGQIAYAEIEVMKYMANLIGWDEKEAWGYFTFGGTSTILNAVKAGIRKAKDDACTQGIGNEDLFVVSSVQGHSAHSDVCNWLGIGSKNCIRVPVDDNYQIDIEKAKQIIIERIEKGGKLVSIIGCGGTTIQMIVDPIEKLDRLRREIVKKYHLSYMPHLHVDLVVGWPWLFFKGYNYSENPLKISEIALKKILKMENMVSEALFADTVGIDFHKTGFCPYASSLFLSKSRVDVFNLNDKPMQSIDDLEYGRYSPSTYTLELSRSSVGPLSALATLKVLGINGFRKQLGKIMIGVSYLVERLDATAGIEVINKDTTGACVLFVIKPIDFIDIKYSDFYTTTLSQVEKIALYNYHFYLFVLSALEKKRLIFLLTIHLDMKKLKMVFIWGF